MVSFAEGVIRGEIPLTFLVTSLEVILFLWEHIIKVHLIFWVGREEAKYCSSYAPITPNILTVLMIQINNFSKISFHLGTISLLDRLYFNNWVVRKVEKMSFLVESAPQAFYKTLLFCLHQAHECLLIFLNCPEKVEKTKHGRFYVVIWIGLISASPNHHLG